MHQGAVKEWKCVSRSSEIANVVGLDHNNNKIKDLITITNIRGSLPDHNM